MRVSKLLSLWLVVGSVVAPSLSAQTIQPNWIADPRTRCKVWNANPQPDETVTWGGACANGLAQGRGVLQWFEKGKPTALYEGELRDGKHNGWGVSAYANGNRYEGQFRDGELSGHGVYTWAGGGRYEGDFRNNSPNGTGILTKADGTIHSGTWMNGNFQQGDRSTNTGQKHPDGDARKLAAVAGEAYDRGDYETAVRLFQALADRNFPVGQLKLADCYRQGLGVERDYSRAAYWYEKAARQGHPVAQYSLGTFYLGGAGVERNPAQAAEWFRKAAEQDFAAAQNALGRLFKQGLGVSKSPSVAVG